jgi:hypothetical protein
MLLMAFPGPLDLALKIIHTSYHIKAHVLLVHLDRLDFLDIKENEVDGDKRERKVCYK